MEQSVEELSLEEIKSIEKQAILEGIARGEKAIAEGRIHSHEEAKEVFSKWLR